MEVTMKSKTRFIVFFISLIIAGFIFYLYEPVILPLNRDDAAIKQAQHALRDKDYVEASAVLTEAIRLNPRNADLRYLMAQVYFGYGDSSKAIEQYAAALQINPFHSITLRAYGLYLLERGQLQEADSMRQRLDQYCARTQDCAARNELAAAFARKEALQNVLPSNPQKP